MSNKIKPTTIDATAPTNSIMNLMKAYVDSKVCYHSDPLKTAQFVSKHSHIAYQIDFWTLMDKRKFKRCEKPYNGEPIPSENLRGLFDYKFKLPSTVLSSSRKECHNLVQTQRRSECFKCDGVGSVECSSCRGRRTRTCWGCTGDGYNVSNNTPLKCLICSGRGHLNCLECAGVGRIRCKRCKSVGHLLIWWQLKIKWSTIHSVSCQTDTPVTERKIRKAPTKENHWQYDNECSHNDTFYNRFESDFVQQKNSEDQVKLDKLADQFNRKHLKKTKKDRRIVRLKCNIQRLNITEVVYEIEDYTNKQIKDLDHKFRFYYYGQDEKDRPLVYENDYPLNACGCFGLGCAHRSMCCAIL